MLFTKRIRFVFSKNTYKQQKHSAGMEFQLAEIKKERRKKTIGQKGQEFGRRIKNS